ncbi:MAG: hypothetical protein WCG07_03320 [Candidatus Taylorbacteria bacterium]
MIKKFYIIPGWGETCRRRQYQSLAKSIQRKGYEVVFKNIDWSKTLSKQLFAVEKDSIVFGFSMGAILAKLITQSCECEHLILASMTPLVYFKGGKKEKLLIDAIGKKAVFDIKKHLKTENRARNRTIFYGDKEGISLGGADVLVKNTEHEISPNYIKEILKVI